MGRGFSGSGSVNESSAARNAGESSMAPGKRSRTAMLPRNPAPIQRRASSQAAALSSPSTGGIHDPWSDVVFRPDIYDAPESQPTSAPGTGARLPAGVQAKMGSAMGFDFSDVRIHQGSQAASVGALAYTQGTDIHFAPGQYNPESQSGQELLGHELAHVVQQASGRVSATAQSKGTGNGAAINDDPALEREADEMGARAARGEAVGSAQGSSRLGRPGVLQRMIDRAAPGRAAGWDAIDAFVHRTLINPRKQTFAEAVHEHVATEATGHGTVSTDWTTIANELAKAETDRDRNAVLGAIRRIITTINDAKSTAPDHPNKRGIAPSEERYETIPQSAESKRVAADLRTEMLTTMYGARYSGRHKTYDRRAIAGKWASSFMLGALVLPDGSVHVSHSGFMGPTQSRVFKDIVEAAGHTAVRHDSDHAYSALQRTYKDHLHNHTAMPAHHGVQQDSHDRSRKEKVFHVENMATRAPKRFVEKGNPVGVCAAPQGMHPLAGIAGADFPAALEGGGILGLTEVLVRDNARAGVTVKDKGETSHEYKGRGDVPSCLTCQFQLRHVMKLITDRRRNIVNRDTIKDEEAHRYQLVEAAETLIATLETVESRAELVQTILPGATGISRTNPSRDINKLEALLGQYKAAIDTQAKERTQHPEHIESRDPDADPEAIELSFASTDRGLDNLMRAKTDGRTSHYAALWQKRQTVAKVIDAAEYSDAREKASTEAGVADKAVNSEASRRHQRTREEQDHDAIIAEATRFYDKLGYYQQSGYLTAEQAESYRSSSSSQLDGYWQAVNQLAAAKPDDRETVSNTSYRIELGARIMGESVRELGSVLLRGERDLRESRAEGFARDAMESSREREMAEDERVASAAEVHESRAQEFAGAAMTSSQKQDEAERDRVRGERDRDKFAVLAAGADAKCANRRREARAEEEARRLEQHIYNLASLYDTSLETAFDMATNGGQRGSHRVADTGPDQKPPSYIA